MHSLVVKRTAAAAAIVVVIAVLLLCYRRYVTNVAAAGIEASTAALFEFDPARAASMARTNLRLLRNLRTGSPDDQRIAMAEAANLLALNRYAEAEAKYNEALRWGKRPEIYLNLATVQANNGEREAAIDSLVTLIRLDPFMLADSPLAELREIALSRFLASVSPEVAADTNLSLAIGYVSEHFYEEGADAIARGALYDRRIFGRDELRPLGSWVKDRAIARYRELKDQGNGPTR
jgi:tetratricopeptide (TPR) repeat protein